MKLKPSKEDEDDKNEDKEKDSALRGILSTLKLFIINDMCDIIMMIH